MHRKRRTSESYQIYSEYAQDMRPVRRIYPQDRLYRQNARRLTRIVKKQQLRLSNKSGLYALCTYFYVLDRSGDNRFNVLQVRIKSAPGDAGNILSDTALFLGETSAHDGIANQMAFAAYFTTSAHKSSQWSMVINKLFTIQVVLKRRKP